VLIGRQGRAEISAAELARLCGTIPYETATALSSRVPRVAVRS
jgi:alanine racemase